LSGVRISPKSSIDTDISTIYKLLKFIGPRLKSGKGLWNGLRFTMERRRRRRWSKVK